MNRRPDPPHAPIAVDLAREPDFTVGGLKVCPSRRQVSRNGLQETVQPRVLQALVKLFRARGAVVSREELIESCWDGLAVGDDAINRCIAKVRSLADVSGTPAFRLETIPRVGYRLVTEPLGADALAQPTTGPASPLSPSAGLHAVLTLPNISVRQRLAFLALCALLVGVVGWLFKTSGQPRQWTIVESHQPFIGTSQIERFPALSPDGTMLAYSAGSTIGNRQIFLRIIKSDSSIQLTHQAYDAMSPAWSPDGATIAYSIYQSGKPCRIMEMQIPSGQPYQVGRCRIDERATLSFDPSGHALVFNDGAEGGNPDRLVRLDTDTGNVAAITTPPDTVIADDSPSFSPDGRYLIYNRELNYDRNEIRLRTMSDGHESVVAVLGQWECATSPAWAPDGNAILTPGDCLTGSSLLVYPLNGGRPSKLVTGGNTIGRLSVSANGYVAAETSGGHTQLLAFGPQSDRPPMPLDERSGLTAWCVDFASDGTLAVTGRKGMDRGVWIADRQGSPFRKLISLPDAACSIRWSPDGKRLAFVQVRDRGFDVAVVSRNGETAARFHFPDKESGMLAWGADGKSVFTSRLEKHGWRIWRTDLSTLKSVPASPFGWLNPGIHGTMLFAEKANVAGVWRIDQGKPQRISNGPPPESEFFFLISRDRLYYADKSDPEHPAISAMSIYGGAAERLIELPFGLTGYTFGVNPSSGDIVFSVGAGEDTDIALIRLEKR